MTVRICIWEIKINLLKKYCQLSSEFGFRSLRNFHAQRSGSLSRENSLLCQRLQWHKELGLLTPRPKDRDFHFSCRTLDKGTYTTRINVLGVMQRPERESNPVSSDLEWNMTKYAQCHETVEIDIRCTFKTVYRDHYMVSPISFAILVQRAHVNPRAFNTWADIGPLELSWYNICNWICQVNFIFIFSNYMFLISKIKDLCYRTTILVHVHVRNISMLMVSEKVNTLFTTIHTIGGSRGKIRGLHPPPPPI